MCHHCGFQQTVPRYAECQQRELIDFGVGTEQLEKTLTALFPDKCVIRIDVI